MTHKTEHLKNNLVVCPLVAMAALLVSVAGYAQDASFEDRIPELSTVFTKQTLAQIRAGIDEDCRRLFPTSAGSARACAAEQLAYHTDLRTEWSNATRNEFRVAILFCMDKSATLNGYRWDDVSYCYQRVALKIRNSNP